MFLVKKARLMHWCSNLSQARLGTLEQDLDMHGTDFNLATSILFVGYLLMQIPSNLLLTRVRPSLFLGIAMCVWGVISTCQAATHSFAGLVVARFFLGFVEAPFFPGAVMLMYVPLLESLLMVGRAGIRARS